jgi:DNA-directed RNA polymerase specialized sigma24 family protein
MGSLEICRPHPAQKAASEVELVARAQQGEEAAFFALYELHKAYVYDLCLRLVRTAKDAEELTRSVFLSAFRQIWDFKEDADFVAVLQNLAIRAGMALRRERSSGQHVPSRHANESERGQTKPACGDGADISASGMLRRSPGAREHLQDLLDSEPGPSFWN